MNNYNQLMAENLPDGIVILSDNNRLLWWNQLAARLLGLEKEHQDQLITKIIKITALKDLLKNNVQGTIEIHSPYRPELRLSLLLRPYEKNERLIIITDVTPLYRIEAMRQDLIANVSHELRTPLTVFRGYVEILKNNQQLSPVKASQIYEQMDDQCQRMERLVQDLLLLSRLESDVPDVENYQIIDVAALLRTISEEARLISGEQHHELHLHLDNNFFLEGQPEEIRSAFSNIIFNAVHYTPAGGKIDIYWYQDEEGKHMKVVDTGIGIPAKYIPRITQRFYRVDKARSQNKKGAGTGLGLAIVKHVLLRHNARLTIESTVKKGSTFLCTFKS